jgi:hypothetical protein
MRVSCQVDKESEQLFLDLRGFMCAAAPQYLAEHPGSTPQYLAEHPGSTPQYLAEHPGSTR